MNTFLKLAKDPSCLLAVHPAFGGSWWSRLKPSDLRVFVGDPMTWDRTMEALNALTGNWAFEIRLYVKDGLTGQVFNNLSQAPLKLYDDLVSSGEASFYLRNYVTMSEWTGWHVIRLEVTDGNASLYLDGIFQATKSTGTTITPVTRDSATDADIGIDYIKLENLTSGAVLWHSEYQDTHAIYKARDFSTSYQWPAVGTALRTIPWTDDYHFHFVFTVPDSLSNGSYWLMYQSNGRIVFSLDKDARGCRFAFGSFAFADNLTVYTPFQPSLAGTHDVTLTVSGTMLSLALDGTVYEQTGERTASSEYDRAVTTSAPVTIHEITLTDDTSSTEVWHAAYIDLNAKYPALPWPAQVMYSPLPRNFAANQMAWLEFSAVAAAVGTDGFSLEITFNRPSKTAGYLFYGDHFFGFMLGATNILCRISVDNYVFIEEAVVGDLSGRHTLKMTRRQGGVDYYLDGALVKTNATAWDVDLSLVFTAGRYLTTDLDGTVESIALMNDTTGETVWQAAYSDLYDTSNPWPSPVPRNFAEEPMTWRDEKTTAPSIGEDDCEFFIRYRLDGYPEGSAISQIFYHNSQNGSINIAFAGDGTGGNYSVIRLTDTDGVVIPLDRIRQLGEHTIRIQRVGLFVTVEFDGEVVATSSAGTKKIAVYSTTAPVSDFDGVIFETYWKSLTTGRTVWRYPSDAERVRLITKTNIIAAAGMFKVGDSSSLYYVDTQLDLRGYDGDLSVVAHINVDPDPAPASATHYHILSQGGPTVSNTQTVYVMYVVRYPNASLGFKFLISDGTRWYEIEKAYSALTLDKVRTIGVVLHKEAREQRWFVNGEYIGSVTVPASWASFNKSANAVQTTRIGPYVFNANYWPAVPPAYKSLLCFGRALSDGEIAAVSNAVV